MNWHFFHSSYIRRSKPKLSAVNDDGSDFFYIQKEDKNPYLTRVRIVNFVQISKLLRSDMSMSLFATKDRQDFDTQSK